MQFPTQYSAIVDRIDQIDVIKYSKTRNFLDGSVTYLSPYLTHGVISLMQVMESILKKYNFKQAEKLIFELAWKEYFQRVWENKSDEIFNDLKRQQSGVVSYTFPKKVYDFDLGIKAIDQAIKELYEVGYMHNHARMWTASIVCSVGGYHWSLPAKWLYYHLLDGDLASNSLSWQWVAGSFSSKKYYANQVNLNKYSGIYQTDTFLDIDYADFYDMQRPVDLISDITDQEMSLETDLSNENIQSLTDMEILNINNLSKELFVYHPWMLSPENETNRESILFLEESHFKKFPISNNRLKFILDLAINTNLKGVYIGEITDFTDFSLITQYYPAISHWKELSSIRILAREYMFDEVDKYFGSFFGYWKKCLKQIEKNPGMYKYH